MIGGHQTGSWWCKQAKVSTRLRSSERMRYLRAYVEILINALMLPANQREDGDGPIQSIVTNLCEGSRKGLTEGLRTSYKLTIIVPLK